jgi:hypothetical protein
MTDNNRRVILFWNTCIMTAFAFATLRSWRDRRLRRTAKTADVGVKDWLRIVRITYMLTGRWSKKTSESLHALLHHTASQGSCILPVPGWRNYNLLSQTTGRQRCQQIFQHNIMRSSTSAISIGDCVMSPL